MTRGIACLFLLTTVAAASAQEKADVKPRIPEPIALSVRLAAAPSPALKYHFLPELRELTPGNAVPLYYRAFSPEWQMHRRPEVSKLIDAWSKNRRGVPDKALRWVLTSPGLKEIDLGARRAYCEWELTERLRKDGINLLIPDIQAFREYINLLAMRARLQIADGQRDQAVYTLQTGFAFARHVSEGPTFIQSLVGIAMTSLILEQVEELLQTPDAPNLYWALTDMPRPFIDLRKPYQGERIFLDNLFPGVREMLADPKAKPLSEARLQESMSMLAGEGLFGTPGSGWQARLAAAAMAARAYPESKRYLIANGWTEKQVDAMPLLQIALMYEVHNYDSVYDDVRKWSSLPYWEARPRIREVEERIRKVRDSVGMTLAGLLVPASSKVQLASARTQRRIDALRCVEAIRLHGAAHDGKLPASFDAIKEVPIPRDPMTGESFTYTVDGSRAVLTGLAPTGETATQSNTLQYEITIRAGGK